MKSVTFPFGTPGFSIESAPSFGSSISGSTSFGESSSAISAVTNRTETAIRFFSMTKRR